MAKSFSYYEWNRNKKDILMIDSKENPIDSLESAIEFFERDDNLKWKWIILSLHHSLYLFCIANLEGTSYTEVLSSGFEDDNTYFQKGNDKWKRSKKVKRGDGYVIKWEEVDEERVFKTGKNKKRAEKLISFWSAIARVQDNENYMKRYIFSKPLDISAEVWKSIELLNYFRNIFTHYIPTSYAIASQELREICFKVLEPIGFLALESNQITFYDEKQKVRVKLALEKLRELLK